MNITSLVTEFNRPSYKDLVAKAEIKALTEKDTDLSLQQFYHQLSLLDETSPKPLSELSSQELYKLVVANSVKLNIITKSQISSLDY